ncbi:MAG: DNA helicase RecG, partial [Firmicutes bacterium]|nr:DNA helicase RecG [Bacillota bacterium]
MEWDSSLVSIKGIGHVRAAELMRLGIYSAGALLEHYPVKYDDRRNIIPIAEAKPGENVTICARIASEVRSARLKGRSLVNLKAEDESGAVYITWFNQPYLKNRFKPKEEYCFTGKITYLRGKRMMSSPEFILAQNFSGALLPVYQLTGK